MPVEFRVLGPLEIRRDGAPVSLRAAKQRSFLGALLVEHGRVVSDDRLVDSLWPDAPPARAQHALETTAYRLRQLLGADAAIVRRPPGYVLELDPQLLDGVRFEQLFAEARDALPVDPARADTRAADALVLWRGDPFADFTFDSFAQEEIARLTELRLQAEEVAVDAALALGRDVVADAQAFVTAEPGRERRYMQLMVALYRAGRQTDALAVFQRAREALLETGLDPSEELRELQRRILQQDPALLHAPGSAGTDMRRERRPISVVAVEPQISLDLDTEEHALRSERAKEIVARIGDHFDARRTEPFLLVFAQEDHAVRAHAAAAEVASALDAHVGIDSGDAILGPGSADGPVVGRARQRARDGVDRLPPETLARRSDGPFVGRARELEQLRSAAAVLVVGQPGIGKSRLVQEAARLEPVVVGRCTSYATDALAPLREVATALGEPSALDAVPAAEVPLTLRRLCEQSGARVAFDDVQWADAVVCDTIEHLAERGLGVIALAREELLEDRPAFMPSAVRLTLPPLSDEDAAALAEGLGGDASVVERAEGNPLYIEQLLAHAGDGDVSLPPTLRSLLVARLDRLSPGERSFLEQAAVLGRDFDAELVDLPGARRIVASLVRRGFLEVAPAATAFGERYRFRHALIHDAAYESIPEARRSELHERTADALAGRTADEIVGFHLERAATLRRADRHAARLAEDAGRLLAAAGMDVFKLGFAARAANLLSRATRLLPVADPHREELLCELSVAARTAGDTTGARAALDEALHGRDQRVRLRAAIEEASLDYMRDTANPERLVELARSARPVFEALGDDRSLGRMWLLQGWIEGGALGYCDAWYDAAERALAYYRKIGFPTSACLAQIAAALYYGPTPVREALNRLEVLLADAVEDLAGEAAVTAHVGGLQAMDGDADAAAATLRRARSLFEELDRPTSLLFTVAPLEADAARFGGELDRAASILETTSKALRVREQWSHFASTAALLAELLTELRRDADAVRWAEDAERRAVIGDAWAQVGWRTAQARALRNAALAVEAIGLAEATDQHDLRARAHRAAGDTARARTIYEEKGNIAAASALAAAISTDAI
jgi:DNA-binding SARP family transcriptional activator